MSSKRKKVNIQIHHNIFLIINLLLLALQSTLRMQDLVNISEVQDKLSLCLCLLLVLGCVILV